MTSTSRRDAESEGPERPADVQASRMGVVAVRRGRVVGPASRWRRSPAGARRPAARTNGARQGRLTTVKSGPHRIVYRVDLPEGAIYVKHFLVPDWRAMLRQWFRRGKGRNEGKRSQRPGLDRRADDHADRPGRAAEAEVPVRELPRHLGDLRGDPARRVRRAAPRATGPSRGGRRSARSSPRPWAS